MESKRNVLNVQSWPSLHDEFTIREEKMQKRNGLWEEANSVKIGTMSYPCGKYDEHITPDLLTVNHSVLNQRKILQVRHW